MKDYFEVSDQELVHTDFIFQPVLSILKEKGAPISGWFFLKIEPGYKVKIWHDDVDQMYCYVFSPDESAEK